MGEVTGYVCDEPQVVQATTPTVASYVFLYKALDEISVQYISDSRPISKSTQIVYLLPDYKHDMYICPKKLSACNNLLGYIDSNKKGHPTSDALTVSHNQWDTNTNKQPYYRT